MTRALFFAMFERVVFEVLGTALVFSTFADAMGLHGVGYTLFMTGVVLVSYRVFYLLHQKAPVRVKTTVHVPTQGDPKVDVMVEEESAMVPHTVLVVTSNDVVFRLPCESGLAAMGLLQALNAFMTDQGMSLASCAEGNEQTVLDHIRNLKRREQGSDASA